MRQEMQVVSYWNSTSNHNDVAIIQPRLALYLIEILHQTTTRIGNRTVCSSLYLIEILHQTTTTRRVISMMRCCILLKFYIKPQLNSKQDGRDAVVSYWNSTSNHNYLESYLRGIRVVSYWNSTSNHNSYSAVPNWSSVVSYWNSTSNHNFMQVFNMPEQVVSYWNSTSNHNQECRD